MAESKYKFDDPKAAFAEAEKRIQQALKSGAIAETAAIIAIRFPSLVTFANAPVDRLQDIVHEKPRSRTYGL